MVLALIVLVPSVRAQAPVDPRVVDPYRRQAIAATVTRDAAGIWVIDVNGERAVYPNDTVLTVSLQYIQGDTSAQHPYGDPSETRRDGTTSRIASTDVVVRDGRYRAGFRFDKALPPGEYAVAGWFMQYRQRRSVWRTYVADYLPEPERPNPSDPCRNHFSTTKVVVTHPAYWFADARYLQMRDRPLWWRQKHDHQAQILAQYRDWFALIVGARQSLESAYRQVLPVSVQDRAHTELEPAWLSGLEPRAQTAVRAWGELQRGLERCQQDLEHTPQFPRTPRSYWRWRVYGEGHPSDENLEIPEPDAGSPHRPWSENYVMPRLDVVRAQMRRHESNVAVRIASRDFTDLVVFRDRVAATVDLANRQLDEAVRALLVERQLDELRSAAPERRLALARLLETSYGDYVAKEHQLIQAMSRLAREIEPLGRAHRISRRFPVATWPMPSALGDRPGPSQLWTREELWELWIPR